VPLAPPALVRRCPRCDAARAFRSSGRFRINAQARRLDVWLVYRCEGCGRTWNREVVERASPEALGRERLEAWARNDPDLARAAAFAAAGLRAAEAGFRVEGEPAEGVALELVEPMRVRLDRVLAAGLGLSRGEIARAWRNGLVRSVPADPRALARPVRDGQLLALEGAFAGYAARRAARGDRPWNERSSS
jgi:hypothetical protein